MLTLAQVKAHLERISYKPGWSIKAYQGRWEGLHLVINTCVQDAFKPDTMVTLDVHSFIPYPETAQELERWLMWRLARIEVHEMREWFKVDGKVIDSPHAPEADKDL
jgi:hypothetical protein